MSSTQWQYGVVVQQENMIQLQHVVFETCFVVSKASNLHPADRNLQHITDTEY